MRNAFVAAMMMEISKCMVIDQSSYATPDSNCGVSKNGGRRHTVSQAKREATKARAKQKHKRQCRGRRP